MTLKQKGFSLLELIIVLIILGILSAATIPAYQKHITKAKIIDALNFINQVKITATDFYFQHGFWPNNEQIELDSSYSNNNYIKTISLNPKNTKNSLEENILITFKGDQKIEDKSLIITSKIDDYNITWICKSSNVNKLDSKLLPANCK